MIITVLGSGTSHGIPVIGCDCEVCQSGNRRDKRTRASVMVESGAPGAAALCAVIDTGPEFRIQALRAGITGLDAVFLTHAHADHIHGLDDVRPLSKEKPIPVYGSAQTIDEFRERFAYIFKTTQRGGGKPNIETVVVAPGQTVTLAGEGGGAPSSLRFTAIPVMHGTLGIFGWAVEETSNNANNAKRFLYLTDVSEISEESYRLIREGGPVDALIIDGLRLTPHSTHFSFEQALDAALRTGARRVWLTHLCHSHSHAEVKQYCSGYAKSRGLRPFAGPSWDGMRTEV